MKTHKTYEKLCIGSYLSSCTTIIYKHELKPWITQQMFKKTIDVIRR